MYSSSISIKEWQNKENLSGHIKFSDSVESIIYHYELNITLLDTIWNKVKYKHGSSLSLSLSYLHVVGDPLDICDGCSVAVLYTGHSTVPHYGGLQGIRILKAWLQKIKYSLKFISKA